MQENSRSRRSLSFQEGCSRVEFDSSYPSRLNGIISETEFRASMKNINRANSSRSRWKCYVGILAWCFIVGIKLLSVSGHESKIRIFFSPVNLFIFGSVSICLGIIIRAIDCSSKPTNRLRQAIAVESAKYANRAPRPCRWRLDTTRTNSVFDDEQHPHVAFHVSQWCGIDRADI